MQHGPSGESKRPAPGIFGLLCLLVGGGCLLIALIGVVNTAFDLDLALSFSGTSTELPASWEEVLGLAAVGALIIGLTLFGGLVIRAFAAAKGRPLVRIGILVGALGLLVLAGRGLFVLAIKSTYGSMLAYYATEGDLDDVRSELADGPSREDLDEAVHRAAQYDNEATLALLLAAGADMRDSSRPAARRHCALVGRSYAFVKTAIDHGVTPATCPNGENAIWETVQHGRDDAEVARTVALLLTAGWSSAAMPTYANQRSATQIAERKNWPLTLQALRERVGARSE